MERQFAILRDAGGAFPSDPFGGVGPSIAAGGRGRGMDPAAPELELAELDKAELRDVARAPDVRAVAPVIPVKLVFPVGARAAGDAAGGDAAGAADARAGSGPTWGVRAVGADRSTRTGAGVTVAVLDTGIDAQHPAFAGVDLVQEDFSGTGIGDVQGHGTHCAGTIFGRDVDGTRIGVAPGVSRALIGKVLADDGSGTSDMIFRGIQWAVQQGASVVSMSIGFDFPGLVTQLTDNGWPVDLATSAALEGYRANLRMFDALMQMVQAQAAFTSGSILVAAAGNESKRDVDPSYEIAVSIPAAGQGVVSVGALGQNGSALSIAPFSNTFPLVAAPGVDVLSAQAGGQGLVSLNGTSMATPHVAGVLALWWEEIAASMLPLTASTVLTRMLANARLDALASDVDVADRGQGLVQAP
ncbi:S8 family serine peptidase [Cellulomonas sp. ATA003]|uniref:S8 family peptidase n=1 Tax=Cellulomonas sp. ATA003 TaxID=3073064 RepID=UPI002872BF46|nr:S8 family serine peptidase [Cellulomonas sp. ATA003]WNB87280.1 S8 family serine peptidase [Cellulomonas sp. ATA003]